MRRMTPLDTWFLHVEDEADHMHIGSVGTFAGPPPPYSELLDAIAAKLTEIPRYRQRFRSVPLGVARPVWVDDPHFRLEYHVRHTAIPSPGGGRELRNLVGRVMGQQLDRRRPLWETWFVEGLSGGRWAMVSKVHHCVVDGIAGTDLLAVVLDPSPDAPRPVRTTWQPEAEPSSVRLLRDAATDLATTPAEQWRAVRAFVRRPQRVVREAAGAVVGLTGLTRLVRPMPPNSLTGPIGPHRRWAWVDAELGTAKLVRQRLGGTVNDVVLTAITTGYRTLLHERGELGPDTTVRTMVPVSLRTDDERGDYHNRVAAIFISLPVTVDDPSERYAAVRAQTEAMKSSGEPVATAALVSISGIAPPMFLGVAMRAATRLVQRQGQRYVTTVTTNVPGPQVPLYLLGRRMLSAHPYVPIAEGIRTGVAIFSYDGALSFGVTADYDTVPDLDVLTGGIAEGMAELLSAAPPTRDVTD
jgi:diacylglycerol O-acyltransferase / wax synthase